MIYCAVILHTQKQMLFKFFHGYTVQIRHESSKKKKGEKIQANKFLSTKIILENCVYFVQKIGK